MSNHIQNTVQEQERVKQILWDCVHFGFALHKHMYTFKSGSELASTIDNFASAATKDVFMELDLYPETKKAYHNVCKQLFLY